MKLPGILLVAVLMALLGHDASSQTTATTQPVGVFQFPFPPGANLAGQTEGNGMTWAAVGPTGPQITIASNSLAVPGLVPPVGNRARLAGVNGPAARIGLGTNMSAGTLYYSLALRVADLGTLGTNGGTLAALNNATGASPNLPAPLVGRLLIRSSGGGYQLGLSASSGNTEDFWWWDDFFQPNETVFVVCSYTFENGPGNDAARLWVNPSVANFATSNAPPPTLTATAATALNPLSSFVLMQRPQPILPAVTFVDEVRVGTTWASVTPTPPGQLCIDFAAGLPAGTTTAGTTPPYVAAGVIHLTDATNGQANYWTGPIPPQIVQSLSASWRTLIGGGGSLGADGISFNLGRDLGTSFIPEEGAGNGLSLTIDTWDNAGGEVGLEVKWNGQRMAFTRVGNGTTEAAAALRLNRFLDTTLEVTPLGLVTFSYAGFTVSGQLPNYNGIDANQYVFAARTGAANDNHWIDDLCTRLDPNLDFADAPELGTTFEVTLGRDGARHFQSALRLGNYWDPEPDGQPGVGAVLDDNTGAPDDEDGIAFPAGGFVPGILQYVPVTITGGGGILDAWFDWNNNLNWDAPERSIAGFVVPAPGVYSVPVNVPGGIAAGQRYARFRFSTAGSTTTTGCAADGEVEDYFVTVGPAGPGNNPNLAIGSALSSVAVTENIAADLTLSVSNRGPATATGVQLMVNAPAGLRIQSATNSAGGCQVTSSNVVCTVASLASNSAFTVELTVRADFLPEQADEFETLNDLTCVVSSTEADLNLQDNSLTLPVRLWLQLDWGDARSGYPVSLSENGARHRYWPGYRLGALWDRQADGFHSIAADGDDTHVLADEDGITFTTPLMAGATATAVVNSSFDGFLDAWADFNNDGDWADASEQIVASLHLSPGDNTVIFTVPGTATPGMITTRWRLSTTGGLSDTGYGGKGEVEDHLVEVEAARTDVSVAFRDVPTSVFVGQPMSHSVVVSNASSVMATGVHFVVTYAGSLGLGPVVMTSQGSCEVEGNTVRCSAGTLNPGEFAIARITVTPGLQESLDLEARILSPLPDANASNNRAVGLVVIVPLLTQDCFCSCLTNQPWPIPDPLLSSWYTAGSGQYARVRRIDGGPLETTWEGGHEPGGTMVDRVYADIQKIQTIPDFVYVTGYGLASHVMGPWYCDLAHTVQFPNKPLDLKAVTRLPRNPVPNSAHPVTPMGAIGLWVNGTAVYNSLDGFYYEPTKSHDTNEFPIFGPGGTSLEGYWHRDAYFSELITFDTAVFHQQEDGQYHAHASPLYLRYQVGDNVAATRINGKTNYVEQSDPALWTHSPILGWAFDGHPIYGPYGYANPMATNSGIQRMRSGYVLRDGRYGTTDLRETGRTTLPAWTLCMQGQTSLRVPTAETGPDPASTATVDTGCNPIEWTLGRYAEDYAYLGDLLPDSDYGAVWDLDRYNGRCCKTPEFPNGTYAYFVTLDTNGVPAFPYIIGWQYCSTNSGGVVTDETELAELENASTTYSALHPQIIPQSLRHLFDPDGLIRIQWSSREDGTYQLVGSTNLQNWAPLSPLLPSQGTQSSYTYDPGPAPQSNHFFRIELMQDGGGSQQAK